MIEKIIVIVVSNSNNADQVKAESINVVFISFNDPFNFKSFLFVIKKKEKRKKKVNFVLHEKYYLPMLDTIFLNQPMLISLPLQF